MFENAFYAYHCPCSFSLVRFGVFFANVDKSLLCYGSVTVHLVSGSFLAVRFLLLCLFPEYLL